MRLEVSDNPKRKTKYDLVAVHKQELGWVNMDSQAPNKVVGAWLAKQGYDLYQAAVHHGTRCRRGHTAASDLSPESGNKPSGGIFAFHYLFRKGKPWYTECNESKAIKWEVPL